MDNFLLDVLFSVDEVITKDEFEAVSPAIIANCFKK